MLLADPSIRSIFLSRDSQRGFDDMLDWFKGTISNTEYRNGYVTNMSQPQEGGISTIGLGHPGLIKLMVIRFQRDSLAHAIGYYSIMRTFNGLPLISRRTLQNFCGSMVLQDMEKPSSARE